LPPLKTTYLEYDTSLPSFIDLVASAGGRNGIVSAAVKYSPATAVLVLHFGGIYVARIEKWRICVRSWEVTAIVVCGVWGCGSSKVEEEGWMLRA